MGNYHILKDLTSINRQYTHYELTEKDLNSNPINQFLVWIEDAIKEQIDEPNAMVLSTVSKDLHSSSRVVLLKYIIENGFVFFTNYQGTKGKQIESNPKASAVFFWTLLERQIRIEGTIQKANPSFSDDYFKNRPFESQLGAIISQQSEVIPSREYLLDKKEELEQSFKEKKLVRPYYWGGYILIPEMIEFWQGRSNRLSDRFRYKLVNGQWIIERLAP